MELVHPVWKENIRTSSKLQEQRFLKAEISREVVGYPYGNRHPGKWSTLREAVENDYIYNEVYDLDPQDAVNWRVFRDTVAEGHLYYRTITTIHPAFAVAQNDCLVFAIKATAILGWQSHTAWQNQLIMQPPSHADDDLYLINKDLNYKMKELHESVYTIWLRDNVQGMAEPFAHPRKGIVTLGDLRVWVEEEVAGLSKAVVGKLSLFFAADRRLTEQSDVAIVARMVDRGEAVDGTREAARAINKVLDA